MKTRLWKIIFAVLLCGFLPAVSSGQLITIGIEATVTYISGPDLLEGKVTVGSTITGTYTYNSNTPNTNPSPDGGQYLHYSPPYGLQLSVGGLTFMSDPNNTMFGISVVNNYQGLMQDYYVIGSTYNLPLSNGVLVDPISWQLDDYSGTALSSTDLPTTAPILSDWDYNNLVIGGGLGGIPPCYEKTFAIAANVTSAVLIPEPISLLLFGFGLLAIRKHKKEV